MIERDRPGRDPGHRAPAPDAKEMEAMARRAWRERGIVILWPERIKNSWDRQHVLNIAQELYGRR